MNAPTGWVTLVFTDIQGSTLMWERLGNAFQAGLDVHDRAMREAIAANSGYEVKTEGDAFMIAFPTAGSAVRFCLDAQDRLHHAAWPDSVLGSDVVFRGLKVRMGVHVGDPLCRRDPLTGRMDYYGRMVNRAARVGAAGHGGQIVLSSAAYAELGEIDALVTDLGWHALRGFEGRERLWQVTPKRLANHIFPPPRTVDVRRTNLPAQVSSFVGRGQEFKQLETAIAEGGQAITVVGQGGAGKTRLALRAAGELLGDFPGGVWSCELVGADDTESLCAALAAGLGIHVDGSSPVTRIGEVLAASERVLVLLDEADRLAQPARDAIRLWIERAPNAVFLVTSRAPLNIADERIIPLGPLPLATEDARAADAPAVALFCARARTANPTLVVDDATTTVIAELARLLDGLPLAIELAAARVDTLPPFVIATRMRVRLEEDLGALTGDGLTAAVQWAWDQLRPWERAALAQLSVFASGFCAAAAAAVLDLSAWPSAPPTRDVLRELVDRAFVRVLDNGRYTFCFAIHAYAEARMREDAPGRLAAERRHGEWCAHMGDDDYVEDLDRDGDAAAWRALIAERDNLHVATRRAVERGDVDVAGRCAIGALWVFDARGPASRGEEVARLARALRLPSRTEARLIALLARLERQAGRIERAQQLAWRARLIAQEAQDRRFEGIVVTDLATFAQEQGDPDSAMSWCLESLAIHREIGDRRHEGVTLGHLGALHHLQDGADEAQHAYEAALRLMEHTGDRRHRGITLAAMARLHAERGRINDARRCFEEALEVHRAVGNEPHEGSTLLALGNLLADAGDPASAAERFEAALPLCRAVGGPTGAALVHTSLGESRLQLDEPSAARRHLESALQLCAPAQIRARARARMALAELEIREGRLDAARVHLTESDGPLCESGDPALCAELFRRHGLLSHAEGDDAAALAWADEADTYVGTVAPGQQGRLRAALAALRRLAAAASTGSTPRDP